jgi:hypothetical protein
MASYKVPQDVEADDKLIGPFSFRQFVYLIIVALSGAAAWGLFQLFPLLVIIPLPIIVFFGALALPLRKDQPMEIYMAAIVSFYLKPHRRLWNADGIESLIEITVPKVVEFQRTKNISQDEAQQRLGYLAELVDSQGWSVRGVGVQTPNSAMNSDVFFAAQQTEDILDSSAPVAQSLDFMIGKSDEKRHQDMMDRMRQTVNAAKEAPAVTPTPAPAPFNFFAGQQSNDPATQSFLNQAAVTPVAPPVAAVPTGPAVTAPVVVLSAAPTPATIMTPTPAVTPPPTTSEKVVSPDIMNLANDADLSIETIAHEANRLHQRDDMQEEVVISLR